MQGTGNVGKCPRLAHAEKESNEHQQSQAAEHIAAQRKTDDSGQRREERPPQNDADQDLSRAEDVAQPAAGHLEQRVGQREGREGPPQIGDACQAQIANIERTRPRRSTPGPDT